MSFLLLVAVSGSGGFLFSLLDRDLEAEGFVIFESEAGLVAFSGSDFATLDFGPALCALLDRDREEDTGTLGTLFGCEAERLVLFCEFGDDFLLTFLFVCLESDAETLELDFEDCLFTFLD